MISSFFLWLSRGSFTTFLSLIPRPLSVMYAIDVAIVRRSEAQLRLKQPQIETTTLPASSASSTSAPSSSTGGMTLEAVMAQLQYMDARLDKLSDELCQVNTYVGCIARRQAHLGGFVESPSPSLEASEDEDGDFDNDNDDEDEDEDVSSPIDDEMPT